MVVNFMKPSPVLIKLQGLQNPVTSTVKILCFAYFKGTSLLVLNLQVIVPKRKKRAKQKLLILSGSDGGALKCMHAHLCQV